MQNNYAKLCINVIFMQILNKIIFLGCHGTLRLFAEKKTEKSEKISY